MLRRDFLGRGLAAGSVAAAGGMAALLEGFQPRLARAAGAAAGGATTGPADSRTIRVLAEGAPNTLDPAGDGYNIASVNVSWNVYDRLVTFGAKPLDGPGQQGAFIYDYDHIVPQAAERFEVSDDGRSLTFHMRPGAVFHDGTPVTAHDAKWSLDRVVSLTMAKNQMATGSMTDPGQFTVVDDMTLRVTVPRADRFTLPNLALLFPAILNSKLIQREAGPDDPWGARWLKTHTAGGGPFELAEYRAGQQFTLAPFAKWRNGAAVPADRVLYQIVPESASRLIAAQRGAADMVRDLPGRDIRALIAKPPKGMHVLGVANPATVTYIAMDCTKPPFDRREVRQAVAWAVPYQAMFRNVLYERGVPMFDGGDEVTSTRWPAPLPYHHDIDRAKALMKQAGLEQGFATSFAIDAADTAVSEPVAVLLQESLARIGIRMRIDRIPSGQMGTLQTEKKLPMFIAYGGAWLRSPDYYFRIFYQGDTRWNYGSFHDAGMDAALDAARWETDPAKYDALVRKMIGIARTEVPLIQLWSAFQDTVLSDELKDYTYMFHRSLELRSLKTA